MKSDKNFVLLWHLLVPEQSFDDVTIVTFLMLSTSYYSSNGHCIVQLLITVSKQPSNGKCAIHGM
jgi:hypothetical protein